MCKLKRLIVILISIAVYNCQGADGPVSDALPQAPIINSFNCPTCGRNFPRMDYLAIHVQSHATAEKPYACTKCSKIFTCKSFLNVHMQAHRGEKPYRCPQCSKDFLRKGDLNRHTLVHTTEQPYHCSKCSTSFAKKVRLTAHLRACKYTQIEQREEAGLEGLEHPDILDEYLKSKTAGTKDILGMEPEVLEKIWDTTAAAAKS